MKKNIFAIFIFSLCFHQPLFAQELKSEFLFDLVIDLDPPQVVGPVQKGTRLIFPFRDGVVKGDKINGKIVGPSAEWGLVPDAATFRVDVRATIKTDDGALIYITYSGYNYTREKDSTIIKAGKVGEPSPSDSYFRTSVFFETSASKYAWLNHTIAVGVGRLPAPDKVVYRIYAIR